MAVPTLTSLSPSFAVAGGTAFTLTLVGTGFDASAVVNWNTTALTTTYGTATQITAAVPATLIALSKVGIAEISVTVTGGTSNLVAFPVPSALDLTTVAQVKDYVKVDTAKDDNLIQVGITGFSAFVLTQTGRANADGSMPVTSPLVTPVAYNEWYDGNNHNRMFLRNSPIVSVSALVISGRTITQSTVWGQAGFVIDQNGRSLSLRSGGGMSASLTTPFLMSVGPMAFVRDDMNPQNVNVQYTAGYAGVPPDLGEMAMRVVGQNYKRAQWIDLASKSLSSGGGGTGTTSYRDWALAPLDALVLMQYKRIVPV